MGALSFKQRFVAPILKGLIWNYPNANFETNIAEDIRSAASDPNLRPKWQTIRAHRKDGRVMREGETIALYHAQRSKACFLIGTSTVRGAQPIRLNFVSKSIKVGTVNILRKRAEVDAFARDDGFADWDDMREFWRQEHPDTLWFDGIVTFWGRPA